MLLLEFSESLSLINDGGLSASESLLLFSFSCLIMVCKGGAVGADCASTGGCTLTGSGNLAGLTGETTSGAGGGAKLALLLEDLSFSFFSFLSLLPEDRSFSLSLDLSFFLCLCLRSSLSFSFESGLSIRLDGSTGPGTGGDGCTTGASTLLDSSEIFFSFEYSFESSFTPSSRLGLIRSDLGLSPGFSSGLLSLGSLSFFSSRSFFSLRSLS
uniref:(northern house mosquito) hypothetical protein n=1 Tax=Culex pipiens TaxID=7175 RepID=A0A8D8MHH0_CULPI